MNKADFSRLRKIGGWVQFKDGDEICNTEEARQYFYILVDGIVEGCYEYEDALLHSNGNKAKRFYSGDCFDYRVLNILGAFVGRCSTAHFGTPRTLLVMPPPPQYEGNRAHHRRSLEARTLLWTLC